MEHYDKEDDILFLHQRGKITEHSRELENVKIVLDFDKEDNLVGVEIFDFKKKMEETQKKIDKIFKIVKRKGKGKAIPIKVKFKTKDGKNIQFKGRR